jgi:hypothetical protein
MHAGTFVSQTAADGVRRAYSQQFNYGRLSIHYDAAYFDAEDAATMRQLFACLRNAYLEESGSAIGIAIDRLGTAAVRSNLIDANLDLCIAMEIAFLFGVRDTRNEKLRETIAQNARVFFRDGEFYWGRDLISEIASNSYKQRCDTIHGRRGDDPDRYDTLTPLNVRLREVLKACLRAYVERRPTKAAARRAWMERTAAREAAHPLTPIFV